MKDRISQLMDGELDDREAAGLVESLGRTGGEARDTWRTYHLISDAMRDTPMLSAGFAARLADKLEQEPTVLAPRSMRPEREPAPWLAMPAAIAASFAALALVGWLAFAPQSERGAAQLAQVPAVQAVVKPVALSPQTVPLPRATPDYLFAHQGFSPRASLQGMAPYARTVSDQATEGRK